jgi:hypothetical protein
MNSDFAALSAKAQQALLDEMRTIRNKRAGRTLSSEKPGTKRSPARRGLGSYGARPGVTRD